MYGVSVRYWQFVSCQTKQLLFPNTQYGMNNQRVSIGTAFWPKWSDNVNGTLGGMYGAILEDLSRFMNFTYDLVIPTDGEWGVLKSDGTWDGVVGQLEDREVDFVVAPLAMNARRNLVLDYSDFAISRSSCVGYYKNARNRKKCSEHVSRTF